MGQRSLIIRLALVILSLLFQFLGILFLFGYGGILVLILTGTVKPESGAPSAAEAAFPLAAGLVLFVMGRASWKAQKRLGRYYKAYKEELKSRGEEDSAAMIPFFGSYDYAVIYDYTNVFVNTIMRYVQAAQDEKSRIKFREMGSGAVMGIPFGKIQELPEGFLIYGHWRANPSGIYNIDDKANHVMKGRKAVVALFNLVPLPPPLGIIAVVLFFFPFHESIIHKWFLKRKKESLVTPLNIRV